MTGRTTTKGTVPPGIVSRDKGVSSSPTSASTWKKKTVGGTLITVPSGNTALVRRPGMQAFIKEGVIPNSLMPLIQESMARGSAPTSEDLSGWMDDPEKLRTIIQLADAVTVSCCIDPEVFEVPMETVMKEGVPHIQPVPFGDERRDPNLLYVDEVDFEDKMFLMNVAVGGTADLEKFRQEQESHVVTVPARQTMDSTT